MGVDTVGYKLFAFMVSGAMAGLSGVLFAHFTRFIAPAQFGFERAVEALLYAIVGGIGSWIGPALGGAFLTLLPEVQRQIGVEAGWLRPFINGVILLIVILFLPGGLAGLLGLLGLGRGLRGRGADTSAAPETPGQAEVARTPTARPTDGDLATTEVLAQLDEVDKTYGGVSALSGVSVTVRRGEILGLIGPNGAGKTTLVNILTGLTVPSGGVVTVMGTDTRGMSADRVNGLGVSRTFQQVKLFERLTVRENVIVGGHRVTTPGHRPGGQPVLRGPSPLGDRPWAVRGSRPARARRTGGGHEQRRSDPAG
jgi:branched-chain amino acid transport system permease protein